MISCTAIAAALLAAQPGAVVATGETACPARITLPAGDYRGAVLDATGATFQEGAALRGVRGLTIRGGTWGRADRGTRDWYVLRIDASADVALVGATVVGNGDGIGGGVQISSSTRVTVRDSRWTGHGWAVVAQDTAGLLVARNDFSASASDGLQVTRVQQMVAVGNRCHDFRPSAGAHPDCIQVHGSGNADVWLINNVAIGAMQAVLISGATGLRAHGNWAAITTYWHTLTCGACPGAVVTDNVAAAAPGAGHMPFPARIGGTGVVLARNSLIDARTGPLPARHVAIAAALAAPRVGSRYDDAGALVPDVIEVMVAP
jgi:hypothetical protein